MAKHAALWTRDHLSAPNRNFLKNLVVGPTTYTPDLHINLMRPQAVMGIKDGKGYFVELIQLPEPPPLELIFKKN